jgi:hypothetical protein
MIKRKHSAETLANLKAAAFEQMTDEEYRVKLEAHLKELNRTQEFAVKLTDLETNSITFF